MTYAVYGGNSEAAKFLLQEQGVDGSLQDKHGFVAEHVASYMHEHEGRLLEYSAIRAFLESFTATVAIQRDRL